jgi:hypothetical protein
MSSTKHNSLPERMPENLTLGSLNGMGEVSLPTETSVGSGDVPAGRGDAEEEYKKKRNKKKHRKMKNIISFESFGSVTEAKAYKLKASEFGGDTHSAPYNVKGETTWRVHSTYAIDQVSGENNPEERDVVFFEAMPINNDIYIKIGGINNLKRTNGATVGNNFSTTIDEWKIDPKGIAKEASEFLTDATHLKWINKKARSEGQAIKWALKDDYSSVIEDLVNKSLGLSESAVTEGKFDGIGDLVKSLHFEMDPKTAEEKKIELGKRQGEVTKRKQIEGGNYSLRRFRKEINYWDGNKRDQEWAEDVFAGPDHYNTIKSTLGAGPHTKPVKKVRWNQRKYDQWLKDVASNDGWKNAFDMAQNAQFEPGLIDWVEKNFRGDDPLQRIQWDIEAFAESVVVEAKLKISGPAYDLWDDRDVQRKLKGVKIKIVGDIGGVATISGADDEIQKVKDILGLNESVSVEHITEKKLDREDTIKWIKKYMDFVRTTEDFNGSQGGIWVSGEDGDEYKGATIYDYYTSGKSYELGVNIKWEKELNKRGWYSEWYDAGTVMIWEI